jgi:hypothetical protein
MYTKYSYKKRNLVIILLFVMVFIIPISKHARKLISYANHTLKSDLELVREDSTRFADSLKQAWTLKRDFQKSLTDTLMKLEDQVLAGGEAGGTFYIIIGTYSVPENAKTMADQYAEQGYQTNIIRSLNRKGENISMVSVNSFNNAERAKSYLREFRQTVSESAWVYSDN